MYFSFCFVLFLFFFFFHVKSKGWGEGGLPPTTSPSPSPCVVPVQLLQEPPWIFDPTWSGPETLQLAFLKWAALMISLQWFSELKKQKETKFGQKSTRPYVFCKTREFEGSTKAFWINIFSNLPTLPGFALAPSVGPLPGWSIVLFARIIHLLHVKLSTIFKPRHLWVWRHSRARVNTPRNTERRARTLNQNILTLLIAF